MSTPSIKQLRQTGWKVRVLHKRNYTIERKMDGDYPFINNRGGKTTIEVTDPQGQSASGSSVCSIEDSYNRKVGNAIALGRALQNLHK